MRNVLVDSGPLAALFNHRDHHHAASKTFFRDLPSGVRCHTTWEVISEVSYFLDFSADAQGDLLDWLHEGHAAGLMSISAFDTTDLPAISKMMRKYADRPMDLADASLVWLASRIRVTDIATIDRADFAVYRTLNRKVFRNVFTSGKD
jgi:predicted nucleic acid-binding protein